MDVLAGKVDRNGVCDVDRRPRVPLPEYVFYFYTQRTQGTLAEAKECTAKLINAAKEHSENLMATAFLQITGIYSRELYTARHAEIYLHILQRLIFEEFGDKFLDDTAPREEEPAPSVSTAMTLGSVISSVLMEKAHDNSWEAPPISISVRFCASWQAYFQNVAQKRARRFFRALTGLYLMLPSGMG